MRQKLKIPAMSERDMRSFLHNYGLSNRIDQGELECSSCGAIISWETLGGFVVEEGFPVVFCCATECIENERVRGWHE